VDREARAGIPSAAWHRRTGVRRERVRGEGGGRTVRWVGAALGLGVRGQAVLGLCC
jgi:hypothetical protein